MYVWRHHGTRLALDKQQRKVPGLVSSSQGPFVQCLSQLVSFSSLLLLTRYRFIPFPESVFQQAPRASAITLVHTSPISLHMSFCAQAQGPRLPLQGVVEILPRHTGRLCCLERELGSGKRWHVRRDLERQLATSWESGGPGSAQDPRCGHRLPEAIGKPSFPFAPFCSSHCSFESGFSCDSKKENIVP